MKQPEYDAATNAGWVDLSYVDLLSKISASADEDCQCTSAQKSGRDYTVCRRCLAVEALNFIGDEIRLKYSEIFTKNK